MTITRHPARDVMILDVGGRLTADGSQKALIAAVGRVLEEGSKNILLNMIGVSQIDSVGLTELVRSLSLAASRGGQLKLENAGAEVRQLLRLTRVDAIFPMFEDEEQALAAFAATATRAA